jgi:hypothetical protein
MPACPNCHVYKGMFSPLNRNESGFFVCKSNNMHRFTRDKEGNFHSV